MTDYKTRFISIKQNSGSGSWKAILFVFLSIVVLIAIVNAVSKMDEEKDFGKSSWDGEAPFTFLIRGGGDYLAVFQKDPKRFAAIRMDGLVGENLDGDKAARYISAKAGVAIKKYVQIDPEKGLEDGLEDFSSVFTPARIIIGFGNGMDTNVSRYEALRLWWQYKGVRKENAKIIDSGILGDDLGEQSVLGADSGQINRIVRSYTENERILSDNIDIEIVNRSGEVSAGALLETFISSSGGRVVEIVGTADSVIGCLVEGDNSYTREYLAKTFDCDIKDRVFEDLSEGNLTITIGQEFADTYF